MAQFRPGDYLALKKQKDKYVMLLLFNFLIKELSKKNKQFKHNFKDVMSLTIFDIFLEATTIV